MYLDLDFKRLTKIGIFDFHLLNLVNVVERSFFFSVLAMDTSFK